MAIRNWLIIWCIAIPLVGLAQYNRSGSAPLTYKIFFDTSDFRLDEKDMAVLKSVATELKSKPGVLFEISGHTDTSGSLKYNTALSLKRAEAVKSELLKLGADSRSITVVARGESQPFSYMGKYSDKFSRRVEFRQIMRIRGQLTDAKTRKPIAGKVLFSVPDKPMLNEELATNKDGTFEFITLYRPKYYIYGYADGYLSRLDSAIANPQVVGSSDWTLALELKQATVTERLSFDNIYFYEGQNAVMPKSEPALVQIAELLKNNPDIYIEIRGHVNQPNKDSLPASVIEEGHKLSFARAYAVHQALVKQGANPARIKYRGMGGDEMKYPNPQTEDEHEANRRVEVVVLKLN
ncbi:MAG: OmpA family protein [Bacteroidetes bacterium]|jgi:outer membrane protein OmpA-like peptidoglycan-associated protein|nr:OmpA family protein [Bacteroidota bacterium]